MVMTKSAADDTFTTADDWQEAGFDRKQAKALARIFARLERNQEALMAHQKTLASKEDLARLEKNQETLASKENLARVEKNQETLATKDALDSLRTLMIGIFIPIPLALLILLTGMVIIMLDLRQEVSAIRIQMTSLETRMTGLEDRMTNIEDRMTGLEDRMTNIEYRMTGLEGRMTNIEDRMTTLEAAMSKRLATRGLPGSPLNLAYAGGTGKGTQGLGGTPVLRSCIVCL